MVAAGERGGADPQGGRRDDRMADLAAGDEHGTEPVTRISELDANLSLGTAAGTAIMFGDMSGYYVRDAGIEIEGSVHAKFNVDVVVYKAVHSLHGAWVDNSGVRSMLSPTS
jgi:hypothetical protein